MKEVLRNFFVIVILMTGFVTVGHSQIAINLNGSPPNSSAMLDVSSSTKGLLAPRMNTAQRTAISSPADGLMVYDTDTHSFWFYKSGTWIESLGSTSGWMLNGNSGTDSTSSFLGTTNSQAFIIKTNNLERIHIGKTGLVGIGVANPSHNLHVAGGDILFQRGLFLGDDAYVKIGDGFDAIHFWENPSTTSLSTYITFDWNMGGATHGINWKQNGTTKWRLSASDPAALSIESGSGTIMTFTDPNRYVGIGTSSPSNALHINSTNPLRLEGLQANTTDNNVLVSTSTGVIQKRTMGSLVSGSAWGLAGNSGTVPGTNFIGTTDNKPLVFKVNNIMAGIIDPLLTNTAFGQYTLASNSTGSGNTAFGPQALGSNSTGSTNIGIGISALGGNTQGAENIAMGWNALTHNLTGSNNIAIGNSALRWGTNISNNVALGEYAGLNALGNGNVFLGYHAGYNETGSNKLYIENSEANPANALIYGEFNNDILAFNAKVGIGTTAPAAKLDVRGQNLGYAKILWPSSGPDNYDLITFLTPDNTGIFGGDAMFYMNPEEGIHLAKGASEIQISQSDLLFRTPYDDLIMASNGNIGINTGSTLPTNLFHVKATADPLRLEGLQVNTTDNDVLVSTSTGVIQKRTMGSLVGGSSWGLSGNTLTGTEFLGSINLQPVVFKTNNTERIRIIPTGEVGIGTASPQSPLHVIKPSHLSNEYEIIRMERLWSGGTHTAKSDFAFYDGNYADVQVKYGQIMFDVTDITTGKEAATMRFWTRDNGVLANTMTIAGDGKVGIGTVTPLNQLHVSAIEDPLRLEGLQPTTEGDLLVSDKDGVVMTRTDGASDLNTGVPTSMTVSGGIVTALAKTTPAADQTITIKDGDGTHYHHLTFTKGLLTNYLLNTTP